MFLEEFVVLKNGCLIMVKHSPCIKCDDCVCIPHADQITYTQSWPILLLNIHTGPVGVSIYFSLFCFVNLCNAKSIHTKKKQALAVYHKD